MNLEVLKNLFVIALGTVPEAFTSRDIFTAIGVFFTGLAAVGTLLLAYLGVANRVRSRKSQRTLEDEFGNFFSPEAITNSTRWYIDPDCSHVDPGQEAEMSIVPLRKPLLETVRAYLSEDLGNRHILVLADSGMGKSSFVLNYYARNQRLRAQKRDRLAVVPLGIPDADEVIAAIANKESTVIFLDAFDEDAKATEDHRLRLDDLMKLCRKFKRVVITCRTQFFPRDEEIPIDTGIARVDPRRAGERGTWEFWRLYLAPFTDKQVRAYVKKRYPIWRIAFRQRALAAAERIPRLRSRPMLLAYLPDILEQKGDARFSFELYEIMVKQWLERESRWVEPSSLLEFSGKLALDLFLNRKKRGTETIPRGELLELSRRWSVPLEDWKIIGRSLLNRDAEGNLKFAHRSIMEYLVATQAHSVEIPRDEMTDQMRVFHAEMQLHSLGLDEGRVSRDGRAHLPDTRLTGLDLSGKNLQEVVLDGADLSESSLEGANLRGASLKGAILRGADLRGAILADVTVGGHLDLSGCRLDETVVAQVASLTSLTSLDLRGTRITDAALKHLASLTSLKWLLLPSEITTEARECLRRKLPEVDFDDPTVTDPNTGLMWTRKDNGGDIFWHGANEYAKKLSLLGYADWRLPTIKELESLYDPESQETIKIREPFRLSDVSVWSSTKQGSYSALSFYFGDGRRSHGHIYASFNARALCVRRSGD